LELWLTFATIIVISIATLAASDRDDDDRDRVGTYAIGLWGDVPYSDIQEIGVVNLIKDMKGSCNNLCGVGFNVAQYAARNAANIAWMEATFEEVIFDTRRCEFRWLQGFSRRPARKGDCLP